MYCSENYKTKCVSCIYLLKSLLKWNLYIFREDGGESSCESAPCGPLPDRRLLRAEVPGQPQVIYISFYLSITNSGGQCYQAGLGCDHLLSIYLSIYLYIYLSVGSLVPWWAAWTSSAWRWPTAIYLSIYLSIYL